MSKLVAVLLALVSVPMACLAADQTAPVHGSGVMDGKDKPGQDGWSWAPVPKTQAASKSGQTPGESSAAVRPAPPAAVHLDPGQDPGTPMKASAPHPGQTQGGG